MPGRELSLAARLAIYAQETGEVMLPFLDIANEALEETIRVVCNNEDLWRGGEKYAGLFFDVALPSDVDGVQAEATLRICNVDRRIVQAVRSVTGTVTVTLNIALASQPDETEAGPFEFTLKNAQYDALVVEGRLSFEDLMNDERPKDTFNPATAPGLF